MFHPVAIALSPNSQTRDVLLAVGLLLQSWRWKHGLSGRSVERWFKRYLGNRYNYAVDSGRSALMLALQALDIREGDEVITQAFTCTAVPAAVIWAGAKPIWVDIDETYNINPDLLAQAITRRTKAIIVQNTFGTPANYRAIKKIADTHHIPIIEDCAHALGATYNEQKIGTLGSIAIFSFGRDKVVSSVSGGLISTNGKQLRRKLDGATKQLRLPSHGFIAKQLFHIVFFTALVLPFYRLFGMGKAIHALGRVLKLTTYSVTRGEKKLQRPAYMPARLPNALARIALSQLKRLEQFNNKRITIARQYQSTITTTGSQAFQAAHPNSCPMYVRVGFRVANKQAFLEQAKKQEMYLGNWYDAPITPLAVDPARVHYTPGSCPHAEHAAESVINLPTYPRLTAKQIQQVIQFTKQYVGE